MESIYTSVGANLFRTHFTFAFEASKHTTGALVFSISSASLRSRVISKSDSWATTGSIAAGQKTFNTVKVSDANNSAGSKPGLFPVQCMLSSSIGNNELGRIDLDVLLHSFLGSLYNAVSNGDVSAFEKCGKTVVANRELIAIVDTKLLESDFRITVGKAQLHHDPTVTKLDRTYRGGICRL